MQFQETIFLFFLKKKFLNVKLSQIRLQGYQETHYLNIEALGHLS